MGAIQNDWLQAVGGEFRKPYYKELYDFVKRGKGGDLRPGPVS